MNDNDPIGAIGALLMGGLFLILAFVVFQKGCVEGEPMPQLDIWKMESRE